MGPEGGFTDKELEFAKNRGWADLNFGFTCLKAETAAVLLPAIIIYEWSMKDEADC